jgi:subtilisin-like proprotein convertase family protein
VFKNMLKNTAWLLFVMMVMMVTVPGVARADHNPTPIAVPLLGTQGTAGPYGSSIQIVARGGPTATGSVGVRLLGVTHPCPEDLAVLLIHGADKHLLLSNAGGCRPLQGTSLIFNPFASPVLIPDTQPGTPAYGASVTLAPSNYGAQPSFPAPAPAGPYTPGLPGPATNVNGTWTLYVLDTAGGNRGVIAGGWQLDYPSDAIAVSTQTSVPVPSTGTGPGAAGAYPITFNLNDVPDGIDVQRVGVAITLRHTYPDDLRIMLQSPAGTAVALMANAGGLFDLAPGTILTFRDDAPALADEGPIVTGTYAPTVFGVSAIPFPAPTLPTASTLSAFAGEAARGTWKLWVFDDQIGDLGQITSATLSIDTETFPKPKLDPVPATSTQPFVRIQGVLTGAVSPHYGHWRVTNGGNFYDAGAFEIDPATHRFVADVPLEKGTNSITYQFGNVKGLSFTSAPVAVNVAEFTYSFAEGATGAFFDTEITLANPAGADAPIMIEFLLESGGTVTINNAVAADSLLQVLADNFVANASPSTVVHSNNAVPLAAERTMIWDSTGYGGHGASSVAPGTRWLFAEGAQGFFNTYILLANDNASPTDVIVRFLLEGGGVLTVNITVAAKSRHTLFAGDVPALVGQSFGIDITSVYPIIAERSMYLPGRRLFEGGHESAGVNATSKRWFLAEGATGSFFECFVLLSNPNPAPANVTLTYLLSDGTTIPQSIVLPANSRRTINVEHDVDPRLAAADISTTVASDIGIVVERAMYWPDISVGWREAHNSFGVTQSALRWGVADGRIGGPRDYQTYILLANPNPLPAEIQVRFLKPGLTVTRQYTLTPFSRRNIWANTDVPELGAGTFSADVQVVNYQPIAVEKALYWSAGGEVFAGGTNVTATRMPPP